MIIKTLLASTLLAFNLGAITIGEVQKNLTLEGANGGLVKDGGMWNSQSIKDKVYIMFYVDPDEKDTNAHFSKILKEKKYDTTNYGSIAIINLAATWKPDFVIETLLEKKQKEFPDTIYVKDKKSVLVNGWEIADNASNILVFSKDSKLLFYKSGKMSQEDINKALKIIEENL